MAKKRVRVIFPQRLIQKPVIYTMAKKFDIMPSIRRAKVTATVGEVELELSGTDENLKKGVTYLRRAGVKVEPLVGDIVE